LRQSNNNAGPARLCTNRHGVSLPKMSSPKAGNPHRGRQSRRSEGVHRHSVPTNLAVGRRRCFETILAPTSTPSSFTSGDDQHALNRPDSLNAFTAPMCEEMAEAVAVSRETRRNSVHAVVLSFRAGPPGHQCRALARTGSQDTSLHGSSRTTVWNHEDSGPRAPPAPKWQEEFGPEPLCVAVSEDVAPVAGRRFYELSGKKKTKVNESDVVICFPTTRRDFLLTILNVAQLWMCALEPIGLIAPRRSW